MTNRSLLLGRSKPSEKLTGKRSPPSTRCPCLPRRRRSRLGRRAVASSGRFCGSAATTCVQKAHRTLSSTKRAGNTPTALKPGTRGCPPRKFRPSAAPAAADQWDGRCLKETQTAAVVVHAKAGTQKSVCDKEVSPVLRLLDSRFRGNDGICEFALLQPHPPQRVCIPGHNLRNPRRQAAKIIGHRRDQPSGQRPAFV